MPKVDRLTRVNELIKRELAEELERSNLSNRDGMLLSVTEVNTSVDLHNATVMVSIFGGSASAQADLLRDLRSQRVAMQKVLARHLAFKYTPILNFELDERTAKGDRILEILNHVENDEEHP